MKVVTVLGARPQFIKAAPESRALARAGVEELLVRDPNDVPASATSNGMPNIAR